MIQALPVAGGGGVGPQSPLPIRVTTAALAGPPEITRGFQLFLEPLE